ncbi:GNAT family N-acetyltransferase [candidate division WOR-3 bacterium]|nr:GNAT family N-acetyltransferase [candidate division WOR-3 bacterium]
MEVIFKDIDQSNFYDCMDMEVRDDQPYVASNSFSVAESKIFPQWTTKSVYHGDQMVGFVMYTIDQGKKELYLCRFMIDKSHQGKGYGVATLNLLKKIALETEEIEKIVLSTNPKNKDGIRIYEKYGFRDTGVIEDGEEVFELVLDKNNM